MYPKMEKSSQTSLFFFFSLNRAIITTGMTNMNKAKNIECHMNIPVALTKVIKMVLNKN